MAVERLDRRTHILAYNPDGGEDVFVHYAEIKDDGSTNKFKMLYEGDRVEYTPASSGKGTQAKDVVKLSSGEARSE